MRVGSVPLARVMSVVRLTAYFQENLAYLSAAATAMLDACEQGAHGLDKGVDRTDMVDLLREDRMGKQLAIMKAWLTEPRRVQALSHWVEARVAAAAAGRDGALSGRGTDILCVPLSAAAAGAAAAAGMAMAVHNGELQRWSEAAAAQLTYYVHAASFPDGAAVRARQLMQAASASWHLACDVRFSEVADAAAAVFAVGYVDALPGALVARSFYPADAPQERQVLLSASFFRQPSDAHRIGILRHELGHALGFRHEFWKDERALGLPEPRSFGADPQSVMNYPWLVGRPDAVLDLSDTDRFTAAYLYGKRRLA